MSKQWYVLQAYSGYENQAKSALEERIKQMGMDDCFGDILVPSEEVVEIRGGRKRRSNRKFFPGYVLAQIDMNQETWHLVRNVPRMLGFVGGNKELPEPISEREAGLILERVRDGGDKPRPKVLFEPGDVMRVIDGPFNDFSAVVETVDFEKNSLQVVVQIFGRSTPIQLRFDQVEKA